MLQPLALAILLAVGPDDRDVARETKSAFDDVAARALAVFDMAGNLQDRLRAEGHTLHPDIRGRRLRVEMALDDAEKAVREGRWKDARKWTERASGHLERLEKALTGK